MLIKIPRGWEIPEQLATPEHVYLNRRNFLAGASAAALFTAFSGFYMVYWVSPDNFTVFALTASLCLFAMARGMETGSARYFFVAGLLAGLSHLSRADGLLLLLVAPVSLLIPGPSQRTYGNILRFTFYVLLGYFLVMAPWFVRNYAAVGSPYPSAGTKTLWLTSYDELFRYRDDLTPARYLATGIGPILGSKLYAAVMNLLVIAFGDLQVFLAPFAAIGMWQLRRSLQFLPFFIYAFLLYLAMTLAFTFPSWRGSVLHSSAALLPFLAAAVPPGLDAVIQWIARRRRTWWYRWCRTSTGRCSRACAARARRRRSSPCSRIWPIIRRTSGWSGRTSMSCAGARRPSSKHGGWAIGRKRFSRRPE